ncbi:hypothetical protein CHUAL_006693 [Chamberlinius hualienensis]
MSCSYHDAPQLNSPNIVHYIKVISIGKNIYLFGRNTDRNIEVIEMDSETLECAEFVTLEVDKAVSRRHLFEIHAYNDYILTTSISDRHVLKVVMINTINRRVNEHLLDFDSGKDMKIKSFVINDQLYLFDNIKGLSISSLDLKTLKWILVSHVVDFSICHYEFHEMGVLGTDIFCFARLSRSSTLYNLITFNTLTNKWKLTGKCKIETSVLTTKTAVFQDKIYFALETGRYSSVTPEKRGLAVFDVKLERWRTIRLSKPLSPDYLFAGMCTVDDKIFVFETKMLNNGKTWTLSMVRNEKVEINLRPKIRLLHLIPSLLPMGELAVLETNLQLMKID